MLTAFLGDNRKRVFTHTLLKRDWIDSSSLSSFLDTSTFKILGPFKTSVDGNPSKFQDLSILPSWIALRTPLQNITY